MSIVYEEEQKPVSISPHPIRMKDSSHQRLKVIAAEKSMTMGDVIEHLIALYEKYDEDTDLMLPK